MDNVRMWVSDETPIESQAYDQIKAMAQLPILAGPIAIMPDVHWGKGATVGSVIPTRGAIIPAAVGVDLSCGMQSFQTSVRVDQLPDNLVEMRAAIEQAIPVGFSMHDHPVSRISEFGLGKGLRARINTLYAQFASLQIHRWAKQPIGEDRAWRQLGTLGGGNHMLEIELGDDGFVWVLLHSGSRNVGKVLADVAIGLAKDQAQQRHDSLPDQDLAWLAEDTLEFRAYLEALEWAGRYAQTNRDLMAYLLWNAVAPFFPESGRVVQQVINIHHNYVEPMLWDGQQIYVTRKGAVSARDGELGIIPGSMGTASYIVRGKGNPASYYSCSHGAGRRMSRGQAKRQFTVEDLIAQTQGVESRKDAAVIDEIPSAYKPIDAVIAAQADLIDPVVRLKQVLCVKG